MEGAWRRRKSLRILLLHHATTPKLLRLQHLWLLERATIDWVNETLWHPSQDIVPLLFLSTLCNFHFTEESLVLVFVVAEIVVLFVCCRVYIEFFLAPSKDPFQFDGVETLIVVRRDWDKFVATHGFVEEIFCSFLNCCLVVISYRHCDHPSLLFLIGWFEKTLSEVVRFCCHSQDLVFVCLTLRFHTRSQVWSIKNVRNECTFTIL